MWYIDQISGGGQEDVIIMLGREKLCFLYSQSLMCE